MTTTKPYSLEELPNDILGDIISRVGQVSRRTVKHVMQASPELAKAAQDHRVFKKINLQPLAINPLAALKKYQDLMEKCIGSGNVEAHYIKGIQEYFHKNNTEEGLAHLKKAAEGNYDKGIYLFGIIKLCRGDTTEGQYWLEKLGWKENKEKGDQCWKDIKKSLHRVNVPKLQCYYNTLAELQPTINCSINNMDARCQDCYYLKQMLKFVLFI